MELIRKDSIGELVGHRKNAVSLYLQAFETLRQAREAHGKACIGGTHSSGSDLIRKHFHYGLDHKDGIEETVKEMIDKDMWTSLVRNTLLYSLMDTEERKKFDRSMQEKPIEVTEESLSLNVERLILESQTIFERGLVNAFKKLSRNYRSHDGFRIGDRLVLSCVVTYDPKCTWLRTGYRVEEDLKDVDRVMHVLDKKPAPDYQQGICAALRKSVQEWSDGDRMECETEYWRLRFFKNGNGHLYPNRPDLVQEANKIIAKHYGQVLGVGPDAVKAELDLRTVCPSAKLDFYPTPAPVIDRMLKLAEIEYRDHVLEPSAGEGAIATRILEQVGLVASLTCYEIEASRVQALREGLKAKRSEKITIHHGDFLQSDESVLYDKILMNPPFSGQQDLIHTLAAYNRLAPGGRLISILGGASLNRQTRFGEALRSLVKTQGFAEALPDGSFKEVGTNVSTMLVGITKPK